MSTPLSTPLSAPLSEKVSVLLSELEAALKDHNLWSGMPPSAEAMSSDLPFCVNTMNFTEWLQWIYIMRMRAIIEHGSALPVGSGIHQYAEESLKNMGTEASVLLNIISRLDKAMN